MIRANTSISAFASLFLAILPLAAAIALTPAGPVLAAVAGW
jgi:hypothetical protein